MAAQAFVTTLIGLLSVPESGGLLNSFVKGTTTRLPLYTSASLTTPLPNPVAADSLGQLTAYFNTALSYSWRATTADAAVVLWEADVVGGILTLTYVNPDARVEDISWAAILTAPFKGVQYVATYAALTALTAATGLVDGGVYYVTATGKAGHFRFVSGDTTTADAGTVITHTSGRFFRIPPDGRILASWWGNDAAACRSMWAALPTTTDSNAQLSPGGIGVLPDGDVATDGNTIVFDGKSAIILPGKNTKFTGAFGTPKPVIEVGNSSYVSAPSTGYYSIQLRDFGVACAGQSHAIRSYYHCFQATGIWSSASTVLDIEVHGAFVDSHVTNCRGQGGAGGWLGVYDLSNNFKVRGGRCLFYLGTWTIDVVGSYAPDIECDVEYSAAGIHLAGNAGSRVDNARVKCWFEGITGKAVQLDNTTYDVENFTLYQSNVFGLIGTPTSGVVEIGVSGGAGVIDSFKLEDNALLGPSTTQVQFNSAASKYVHAQHDVGTRNSFAGGAAISFATRPEIETYPVPRAFTSTFGAAGGSPALGNGTLAATYIRVGDMVHYRYVLTIGSTTNVGTGGLRFSLPYVAATLGGGNEHWIGEGYYTDVSVPSEQWSLRGIVYSGNANLFLVKQAGGSVTGTDPIATPATGDQYEFTGFYRAVTL